jgi:excisionase family DNA binding protein
MTNGPRGDILTTFQAARLCGVSHKSIERWIDAGLLPGFRTPGGHRRIYRADLLGFVQSRRTLEGSETRSREQDDTPPRVLVVDDDPNIRSLFSDYFRSAVGDLYTLEVAASGYEAGLQVERFKPHVMVLDLMMPDLDGFAVCEQTRADAAHAAMVFIALTGSEEAGDRAKSSGLFHRVFLKPVKLARIKEAIDELLAERGFFVGAIAGT